MTKYRTHMLSTQSLSLEWHLVMHVMPLDTKNTGATFMHVGHTEDETIALQFSSSTRVSEQARHRELKDRRGQRAEPQFHPSSSILARSGGAHASTPALIAGRTRLLGLMLVRTGGIDCGTSHGNRTASAPSLFESYPFQVFGWNASLAIASAPSKYYLPKDVAVRVEHQSARGVRGTVPQPTGVDNVRESLANYARTVSVLVQRGSRMAKDRPCWLAGRSRVEVMKHV